MGEIKFSLDGILKVLRKVDSNKEAGPDLIPSVYLKYCSFSLAIPLEFLYNKSPSLGVFPDFWKLASVVRIFKSGRRDYVINYRPISKLSIFEKIFQSMVCPHLQYLVRTQIIPEQHGFVKGRSVIRFIECLQENLDLDVIYTDFSTAFARVNIDIFISELEKIGGYVIAMVSILYE